MKAILTYRMMIIDYYTYVASYCSYDKKVFEDLKFHGLNGLIKFALVNEFQTKICDIKVKNRQ